MIEGNNMRGACCAKQKTARCLRHALGMGEGGFGSAPVKIDALIFLHIFRIVHET
jgi:hypothetical protein